MVLAAGSELIEDVRRAPDDVLSMFEPLNEVCYHEKQTYYTHMDYLARSIRIYNRLFEYERHLPRGCNTFQINTGCCRYFQGDLRRARHGYG